MYRFLLSLLSFSSVSVLSQAVWAQAMRYDVELDQKASYDYNIQIDTSSEIITLSGIVSYQVTLVNEQFIKFNFQGGLTEHSKPHPNRAQDFARSFPRPPSIPNFFQRHNFAGKSFSKNQFSMTRTGRVLTLDGTSQLPFLLGNLSLIPFEPLPKQEEKIWRSDLGISINDAGNDFPFAPRPFGPFGFQSADRMQSAAELSTFSVLDTSEDMVRVEKSYELKTPDTGDRDSFQMTGKGTWTFDRKDNLPAASDMQYSLNVKDGNTTTTFPIKVVFSKLTEEKLAQMQFEAKAKQEQAEKLQAERKAAAEAPLVGQELEEMLSDLQSKDNHKRHKAMIKLNQKELQEPTPELVSVVRKLVKSGDMFVHLADSILQKLDPVYKLNKTYEGNGFVESTGLVVDEKTKLHPDQIVQIREHQHGPWYAAEVKRLLSDGKVELRFRGWGQRPVTLARNQIQLAPKEIEQPISQEKDAPSTALTSSAASNAMRTWSDKSGAFKVDATFLGIVDDKVVLKKTDGSEIEVPMNRLSLQDHRYIGQLQEESKKLGNPFEK